MGHLPCTYPCNVASNILIELSLLLSSLLNLKFLCEVETTLNGGIFLSGDEMIRDMRCTSKYIGVW